MIKPAFLIAIAAWMALPSAADRLQFHCRGLEGHAFFAEEGLVPKGQGGWFPDNSLRSEAVITLDASDPENPKISFMYRDIDSAWYNPISDGAYIGSIEIDFEDLSFMFLVVQPQYRTVELISMAEISESGGRMIYSQMKNSSSFMNAKLMTAECVLPE